jgi:serine phosphatase RsbU (regulator of sigma subunit)/anti-sigma regulatory factor (Ser/Thr protein kinase)
MVRRAGLEGCPDYASNDWAAIELISQLADRAPIGLLIVDVELRVCGMNQTLLEINGLPPDHIGDRAISELLPDVEPYAWDVIRQVLATGEPILDVELTGTTPANWPEPRVWRASHYPLRDIHGATVAVGIALVDVSEQRRAEAERDTVEQRLRLLGRASGLLGASLNLLDTLEAITELVVPEFADICGVLLADKPLDASARPDRLALRGYIDTRGPGVSPLAQEAMETVGIVVELDRDNPAHHALATRQPVLFTIDEHILGSVHVHESRNFNMAGYVHATEIDMAIVVPLLVGQQFFGVVEFCIRPSRRRYTDGDVQTAAELGSRISNAVANANAYARQRTAAVTLQRGLLPHETPILEGLDVAWRYEPGTAGTEVGGDWFDIIPLSAGRIALVIGDVMGRGLTAAAVMGQVRTAVRAFAALDLPAADVLTHLDELVATIGTGPDQILVSCIYAIFEPATGTICLANAGHLDPVLVRPDGHALLLEGRGDIILGVGGQTFAETRHPFPAGSTLALFTDGLVESPAIDIDEGCRRLLGALHAPAGAAAAGIASDDLEITADRLLSLIDRDEGYDDDVALLLVRASTAATTATTSIPPEPQAAGAARATVLAALKHWGVAEDTFTVELLVSELVTNAIRYANTPSKLVLRRGRHALYVEVSDEDTRVPRLLHPTADDEGGRGLQLVAELSTQWGARPTRTGKTVWFQLDIPHRGERDDAG